MKHRVPNYSSDVRMYLLVGDRTVEVAQVLVDTCVVREPIECAPGPAQLVMVVDGQERRWPVVLEQGITPSSSRVPISG